MISCLPGAVAVGIAVGSHCCLACLLSVAFHCWCYGSVGLGWGGVGRKASRQIAARC